ncbi:hypothetical protein CAPN004_04430 [Capnocytophaga cynodegmi]|uniref:hypothetical protein n=1 Tax=Capnocytophaga cynodegmi TaxID=28189 RepID=UPI001AC3B84F|nr:hypothetical protein [Capnocytophaga cynodegmi]GIM51413.1 hypothetical protein CAPN004_04430 [Capnocytophaga cynodegmi]
MLKRIRLEDNQVYTIKISDEIYSIVQHRENNFFEFFDIFFTKPNEKKLLSLDLNSVPILCTYVLASNRLKDFFVQKETLVKPNQRTCNRVFHNPFHYMMEGLRQEKTLPEGVALMQLKSLRGINYEVLIEYLDEDKHINEIYQYNSSGMIGNSEKLKAELLKYVETGEFWSIAKAHSFPNVVPYKKGKPQILAVERFS